MPSRRVLSLNGLWDIAFDPKNEGVRQRWWLRFPARTERIRVPGVWEQVRPGYDGVGWYRTRFASPTLPPGGRVWLRFNASAYFTEVWLNGVRLGENEGLGAPFEFEIGARLRAENELVVRVINPTINAPIEGFRAGAPLNQSDLPIGKAAWYFNYGGLWQGVDLLVTGPVRIEQVFVRPRVASRSIEVSCRVNGAAPGAGIEWSVAPKDKPERVAAAGRGVLSRSPRGSEAAFTARMGRTASLWSPDTPHLYTLRLRCADDALDTRFGLREFTIRGGRFLLNGEPIRLKGLLQQGVYPRTLAFPETLAEARRELMLLKRNGFNFLRSHLRAPEPSYLDLADELGILVEAEPPIGWIINSPKTEERCRRAIDAMIVRDRNHPSIVFWCLLNEAYHFLGFTMPQVKALTERLAVSARQLDPTRILMDTSGGGGSGTDGGSEVWLPYSDRKTPLIDAHAYCPVPPTDEGLRKYRDLGRPGLLTYISEYGALEMPPDYAAVERRYSPRERALGLEDYRLHADFHASLRDQFRRAGLRPLFGSVAGFIRETLRVRARNLADITAAIWTNPRISGAAYCQLADASGEQFGVTDIWRRPKPAFAAMVGACADEMAMAFVEPRVFFADRPVLASCRVAGRNDGAGDCRWECVIRDAAGRERVLGAGSLRGRPVSGYVFGQRQPLGLAAGEYEIVGRIRRGTRVLHEQPFRFRVLPPVGGAPLRMAAWDPEGAIRRALRGLGVEIAPFINNTRLPDRPIVMDLRRPIANPALRFEVLGQARKTAQIGGALVLLEPEMLLLRDCLLPRPPGVVPMMRSTAYVRPSGAVAGLSAGGVADYDYAEMLARRWDRADEVAALGGDIVIGSFGANMWTRPAKYYWGAGLYRLKLGRGSVWVCQLHLLDSASDAPRRLLYSLIAEAERGIRATDPTPLLSRCIDPL